MTELNKMIKIDVISVPFSGHLFPTLTLVKPLLEDPRFQIRVITCLLYTSDAADDTPCVEETGDGRYRQYIRTSKTAYYVPTINCK